MDSKEVMNNIIELRRFMEKHIYVVWDFMCLLQNLKRLAYPNVSSSLWVPPSISYESMRMLNEIILSEETDNTQDGKNFISHLDLYLQAMEEIGADTKNFKSFLESKNFTIIPEPVNEFVKNTFDIIHTNKIHMLASSFAYGREIIIPDMFMKIHVLLDNLDIEAPLFRYYLSRHIELDGEKHGPMSIRLVEELIGNDPIKRQEAEQARIQSLESREKLWTSLGLTS